MQNFGARHYDAKTGRWWSVDPLAAKYPSISPYAFCANNPIIYKDIDGRDFVITVTDDGKGNVYMHIQLKAALLNSSTQSSINTNLLSDIMKQQIISRYTYGEVNWNNGSSTSFHVTTSVEIRTISEKKELNPDEHLLEVVNDNHSAFPEKNSIAMAISGTHIIFKASLVADIINGANRKTVAHEIGHTAGLSHPAMLSRYSWDCFSLFPFESEQHEEHLFSDSEREYEEKHNFMYQGGLKDRSTLVRKQFEIIKRKYDEGLLNDDENVPIDKGGK